MDILKPKNLMIVVGTYIVILALFSSIFYYPRYMSINQMRSEIPMLEKSWQEATAMESKKQEVSEELRRLGDDSYYMQKRLPPKDNLIEVLTFIRNKTGENRLILGTLNYNEQFSPEENNFNEIKSLDLDLSLSGQPYALLNFIQALQQAEQIYVLQALSLEVQPKEQPERKIETGEAIIYTQEEFPSSKSERKLSAKQRLDVKHYNLNLKLKTFYVEEGLDGFSR